MDLKEFAKLTLIDANESKNFISFLLGYGFKGTKEEDTQKAILSLFDSFSEDYKKDLNLWEPIFVKFFGKYKIDNDNLPYYNQYIRSKANKMKIITSNPNWQWEETKFEYDSLTDLIKGFEGIKNSPYQYVDQKKFIIDNRFMFEKYILGNKKAENYLISKNFFENFLNKSYLDFKSFCEDFKLDYIQVFEKYVIKKYSQEGIGKYFKCPAYQSDYIEEAPELIAFLKDFRDNDLLKLPNFVGEFEVNSNLQNHVGTVFSYFVANKKFESACIIYEKFEREVLQFLNMFAKLDPKKITSTKIIGWDDPPQTQLSNEFLHEAASALEKESINSPFKILGVMKNHVDNFMEDYTMNKFVEKLENDTPNKPDTKLKKKI